ncbi:MAG: iron-sulfur cluster carrier protein MrpORP [Syntrophales bacterium]|nr:iron-sulfur cluster carrier protein MrpORP [Syntrophales bacterium]
MSTCESRQCAQGGAKHHPQTGEDESRLEEQLRHIRHKLLVMSGKGGVGKTSIAVYLALGLALRGYQVGLLDVDLHGPDVPRMLGISGKFEMDVEGYLIPHRYSDHLQVVSIECLLHDRDAAVIWRGPLKNKYIRQSMSQVNWGELDFLIIDSPPGTGDEPLSVAQTISGVQAVIVTTPQEISLADVRKAINFCRKVNMPILGLVENMSGLVCPHCGGEIPLFSRGGGQKTAALMKVPLLASLPFDLRVVESGDAGKPLLTALDGSPYVQALIGLVDQVEERLRHHQESPVKKCEQILSSEKIVADSDTFKAAIPLAEGRLCNHFGHCQQFAVIRVKEGIIDGKELHTPPPHEPGVLPRWLGDLGVNLIFAGGMGQRALGLFAEQGIKVITGSPNHEPETLVQGYLSGTLVSGPNVCDH